ncbi:receptor like protein 7 [Euphorbia peplus]|nr:receptor like protein 7 [Euphorbia peplus]
MMIVKLSFFAAILLIRISNGISTGRCISRESTALLKLKNNLIDQSNQLQSWDIDGEDCCSWYGIICDNSTGHVLELHLQTSTMSSQLYFQTKIYPNKYNPFEYEEYWERSVFGGKISESLLELRHLKHLDLSNNNFRGSSIPTFLGFFPDLTYLNLSKSGFEGLIPHQLGNLYNLQYLIIQPEYSYPMYVENFDWISTLSSLKFLDLSFVNLSRAIDWEGSVGKLSSLVELHLSNCELTHIHPFPNVTFASLSVLDLSSNRFYGFSVPGWIPSLERLAYLDVSNNGFKRGEVPSVLQNMTSLRSLDLSGNMFTSLMPGWFGGFTNLERLHISGNELEGEIPTAIGNLTFLNTLDMSFNFFEERIPTSLGHLCNLRFLSLSSTRLSQEMNEVVEILSGCVANNLESLDLSRSRFSGYLSDQFDKFKSLVHLDLSENLIVGSIPISLGELTALKSLDLSLNKLNGSIPITLGGDANLESFDVSFNSLEGEISEMHFENLTSLRWFDASRNHRLILRVDPDWIPPFRLVEELHLNSWDVGPEFPSWLRYLKHLEYFDLSNAKISSTLPTWFHNFSAILHGFNLSNNQMHGMVRNLSADVSSFSFIDLSSNHFNGPLPYVFSTPGGIDLSNNLFSGSVHDFFCNMKMYQVTQVIILKGNFLSGEIPDCWMNWTSLTVVELSNNNFSGNIPMSFRGLTDLQMLNLRNNYLIGDVPSSLQHCTRLTVLDLGENELEGEIPSWIGEFLASLNILNLRGNKFRGHIAEELCNLTRLQILDFANNNLNGTIPTCISNLHGMVEVRGYQEGPFRWVYGRGWDYMGSSSVMKKGTMVEYSTILNFVQSFDLSNNKFVGGIPEGITSLSGLQSLNLSNNLLTGRVPKGIGTLTKLESLDLSQNRLFGEIPESISSMTFLSNLNLSNNNLSGQIPSSTQLQGFDPSSFTGNNLCGLPLTETCSKNEANRPSIHDETGDYSDENGAVDWFYFYVSLAPGFFVGFWCVVGPLVFYKRWRSSYFNFLELLWDKICV